MGLIEQASRERQRPDTAGLCKAIGLSDVSLAQMKEIFEVARIKPAVVHVESHPYLPQWDLLDYCGRNGIVLQAFAALGHSSKPNLLEDPVITAIAKRVNKTPAQVLLAWAIQRGTALLTTSKTPSRIKENFEISALPRDAARGWQTPREGRRPGRPSGSPVGPAGARSIDLDEDGARIRTHVQANRRSREFARAGRAAVGSRDLGFGERRPLKPLLPRDQGLMTKD